MQRVIGALATLGLTLLCSSGTASADWLSGTTFSVSDTNDPAGNSITDTATIGTISTIDGGLLSVTTTLIPGAGGSQWIDIDLESTTGTLVGVPVNNWEVTFNGLNSTPSVITDEFVYFTQNEQPFSPLTSWSGLVARTDPLNPSQQVLGFSGFAPFGPETITNSGVFVNPFAAISNAGVDPVGTDGLHFDIQATPAGPAAPEPATFTMFGLAITGLGFARWRKRKQTA